MKLVPQVTELILAHFYLKCPYILPYYLPKKEGQSDEDYYKWVRAVSAYAVFKMLHFLAELNIFRWLNPILVSIARVKAVRTVYVWIGRDSFWPQYYYWPNSIPWNTALVWTYFIQKKQTCRVKME